jgi:hypothetical protein
MSKADFVYIWIDSLRAKKGCLGLVASANRKPSVLASLALDRRSLRWICRDPKPNGSRCVTVTTPWTVSVDQESPHARTYT